MYRIRDIVRLQFKDYIAILMNLTPEARTYKRTRGRVRTPEEKKALVLAAGKAWNEWLSSGKLVKTDKGYELYKI
ncbi:hypothetical protein [Phascolarctobacterium succinatutens]|uniref:hypothetical protein n=1 Tax=Phascolarctobacterium succinatutens TaxID=626940 RepID=UPI003FEE13F8